MRENPVRLNDLQRRRKFGRENFRWEVHIWKKWIYGIRRSWELTGNREPDCWGFPRSFYDILDRSWYWCLFEVAIGIKHNEAVSNVSGRTGVYDT